MSALNASNGHNPEKATNQSAELVEFIDHLANDRRGVKANIMSTKSNSSQRVTAIKTLTLLSAIFGFFLAAVPATRAQGKITVQITTENYSGPAPGTRVDIGSYSVTTDAGGLGSLEIPPGTHKIKVTGQCDVTQVMVSGNIGKDDYVTTSAFTFRLPQNGVYALHFLLNCGQRAETSPAGASGPESTAAQAGPFVKPKKDAFAAGETIVVDYGYAKSSGWDWVVIAEPGKELSATGSHSGITPDFSYKLEPNDNSVKDRRGTITFPGLPEGKYLAKYISWPNGHAVLTSREITVGKSSTSSSSSGGPPTAGSTSGDLSGLWRNPGGNAVYRFRQIGNKLHWGVDAVPLGSFANVFEGDISSAKIEGSWIDLPGSPSIGGGQLSLRIESACKIVKTGEVNHYGADIWVKQNSQCDVVSLTQRSNPSGATSQPPATATRSADLDKRTATKKTGKPVPTVEQIPEDNSAKTAATKPAIKSTKEPPVVEKIPEDNPTKIAASKPPIKTTKKPPVVEEIPEDNPTKIATSKPPKPRTKPPVVEEIPETAGTNVSSNRPRRDPPVVEEIPETSIEPAATSNSTNNQPQTSASSGNNRPSPKPKKEKKPKDPNKPGWGTLLGGAIRQAITQQPTQQPTETQQSAPAPQTTGCQVGPYSLAALNQPRANEQVWMRFTAPAGRGTGSGNWVGVFRAGETQSTNDRLVTWMYLTSTDCVEKFYLPAGQFDAYVFDAGTNPNRVNATRSPISGGVRLAANQ